MEAAEIIAETVDKTKVPPLQKKRVLAFVNHFLLSSCSFLNEFAVQCEERFIVLERKMQKIEAALIILEAKLDSIPDFSKESATASKSLPTAEVPMKDDTQAETALQNPEAVAESAVEHAEINILTGVKACDDVRYQKFFKMVQFGVPANAVKIKMQAEGVQPEILDNPNMMLPDGASA